MRLRRFIPRAIGIASAALLALAGTVALADYRANFAEGIKAIDRKEWSAAIRSFRAAADEKASEGGERISIYGMRYSTYLPYYYLGLSYFRTGNCEEALQAWAESEKQGAILRETGEYKNLRGFREECHSRGAGEARPLPGPSPTPRAEKPGPHPVPAVETPSSPTVRRAETPGQSGTAAALVAQALRDAETELSRSENAAAEVIKLRDQPDVTTLWQRDPSLREREKRANRELGLSQSILGDAKARSDLSRLASAREAAIGSRKEFEVLQSLTRQGREKLLLEGKQARDQETAAAQKAIRELDAKAVEAKRLLAQSPRSGSLPPEILTSKAELEAVLGEVQRVGRARPSSELDKLRQRIGGTMFRLQTALARLPTSPAQEGPPTLLVEAAVAYFEGDYGRAAKTLEKAHFTDRRAATQARLFSAAARYGMYVTGGEKEEQLRERAAQDVGECKRLDPNLIPSARAFSPRFIEFFRRSGPAAKASS